ncbi:MAG TPA: nucleotidyltransferase domain-containing protein [Chthoniobacterales bacterium]
MRTASLPISFDEGEVIQFCRRYGIRRLAFFGSVLREDFASASDVDLLVEYDAGRHPGLMLFRQQDELSALLHRPADLHTVASLSPYFRDDVVASSLSIYEQT